MVKFNKTLNSKIRISITLVILFLLFIYESALLWGIFTFSLLVTLNHHFKSKKKKGFDIGTIAVIVLTIVLLYISTPLLHPRVDVINIDSPKGLIVGDYGGKADRTFTFQITNPVIPFLNLGKSIKLGNKIYEVYNSKDNYGSSGARAYFSLSGDSNTLKFYSSGNRGFDKEITSLRISTDFPISYQIGGLNITKLYKTDIKTFCSTFPILIINNENQSVFFERNTSIFIPNNATIYMQDDLGTEVNFSDYRTSTQKEGCFWLVDDCNLTLAKNRVAWKSTKDNRDGLEIDFSNLGEIKPTPSFSNYYLQYFASCGKGLN